MNVYEKIFQGPIGALHIRPLIRVDPQTTVQETIDRMKQQKMGCAAVVGPDGKPLGKFTERQLIKLLLQTPEVLDEPVESHMTTRWASVRRDESVAHLIDCMEREKLRFVCVVDEEGKADGLVGQRGVVKFLADQFPRGVQVQPNSSKMHLDQREGA